MHEIPVGQVGQPSQWQLIEVPIAEEAPAHICLDEQGRILHIQLPMESPWSWEDWVVARVDAMGPPTTHALGHPFGPDHVDQTTEEPPP